MEDEDNIIENDRYHDLGLMTLEKQDGLDFKPAIKNEVQTEIDGSENCNESSLEQFIESKDFYKQTTDEVEDGTDLVPGNCVPTYRQVKEEVDFKVEIDNFQEYPEASKEPKNRNEANSGIDFVPTAYVQVDPKMEDEMDIEENVKMETDNYQEESKEALQEQLAELEEDTERIKETEDKFKRIVTDPRQKTCTLETFQHSENSFESFRHQEGIKSVPMFACSVCRKENSGAAELKRHMFSHLNEAEITSELTSVKICDNLGVKSMILAKIKGKDYHIDVFKCAECEYIAPNIFQLKYHMMGRHSNENVNNIRKECGTTPVKKRKFDCHLCEYKASRKSHLRNHINFIHIKELTIECHLCEYKTNLKSNLHKHLSCVHLKERKFECQLCEYKANRKWDINRHMTGVHLNERNFACHLCEYKSNWKSNVEKHLSRVHLNERKFQCHVCEIKFKKKTVLDNHISSVHLNERRFECHLCEYKANQKRDINRHVTNVHSKGRKFECHFCEYKTNRKSNLDRHSSHVHLGDRKFKCQLSEYKTKTEIELI